MQAVIFTGVQASGKSTFYKEYFFSTHMRISLDLLKTRNREKLFLDLCFLAKQKFVVDNTNPSREERKRYIVPAIEAGFEIVGYYFTASSSELVSRNKQRQNKYKVPMAGLFGTLKRIEKPEYSEGFNKLYGMTTQENSFIISDLL
jgi:predicted kinase